MKKSVFILAFLVFCSVALADRRVTSFFDDVNRKTGEPYFFFNAGDYSRGLFLNVHSGFSTRKPKWLYHISVDGAGTVFSATKITVRNEFSIPSATDIALAGGTLTIDRRKRVIIIALKIRSGDVIEDFPGNGTYHMEESEFEKKA